MNDTKTFKRYNLVTGAVDGTLAYDFGDAVYYPEPEGESRRERGKRARRRERETAYSYEYEYEYDYGYEAGEEETISSRRRGVPLLAVVGGLCAVLALVVMLLAQIQLVNLSDETVALEEQIDALNVENDRLRAEYEAAFDLKSVEEYARDVLGMQEPTEEQIYYLDGVYPADRAVIITEEPANKLSLGLKELAESFLAYFD